MVLDGFRYNDLPTLKHNVWLSLLPSLPTSDLSEEELRKVHTFYGQLDELDSIKERTTAMKRKMDNERELEQRIAALIQSRNPLAP